MIAGVCVVEPRLLLGVGAHESVQIEVIWPDHMSSSLSDVTKDQQVKNTHPTVL